VRAILDEIYLAPETQQSGAVRHLDPVFEHYTNTKTNQSMIIPIARFTPITGGQVTARPLPPIYNAKIRPRVPIQRPISSMALPPAGTSAGKGFVWAGHLEKCYSEETGEIYYVPVLYIIEEAKAPNNTPVVK